MRATRQTELEREFGKTVACAWIGNSEAVADRHYLLVTAADYTRATAEKSVQNPAQCPPESVRKAAQQEPRNAQQIQTEPPKNTEENEKTPVNLLFTGVYGVETDGLEPTTSCLQSKRSPN